MIALQKDMEVISEAVNGQNAVDKVMRFSPRVALVDIFMPVMSGIEAIKTIRESSDLIRGIGYVSQSKYFSSEFAELVVN